MPVKLLRHCGIVPDMSFKERSNICKSFNQHRCNGMLPANLLECRDRLKNLGRLSPIHAGIFPENLFFPRSITIKELQFPRDEGNSPKKLLLFRFKVLSPDNEPKEVGTSPKKLLPDKFKTISFRQCIKQLGSHPDIILSDRSRKANN